MLALLTTAQIIELCQRGLVDIRPDGSVIITLELTGSPACIAARFEKVDTNRRARASQARQHAFLSSFARSMCEPTR